MSSVGINISLALQSDKDAGADNVTVPLFFAVTLSRFTDFHARDVVLGSHLLNSGQLYEMTHTKCRTYTNEFAASTKFFLSITCNHNFRFSSFRHLPSGERIH